MSSKYSPLAIYLEGRNEELVSLTFDRIEEILGSKLPSSARNHTAWWSNTRSHLHAFAWMDAGFKTVDFCNAPATQRITFKKEPII